MVVHHESFGVGGVPGETRTDMIEVPAAPPGQPTGPFALTSTCRPVDDVYAARAVLTDILSAAMVREAPPGGTRLPVSVPPKFAPLSRYSWPFFVTAAT